jgi:hypothetical protein
MKNYIHSHGVVVDEEEFDRQGYGSLPVCEFLIGRPWDELSLSAVVAVTGTKFIRVRTPEDGSIKLDGRTGRVTIFLDEDGKIESLHMECVMGLPEGYRWGDDVMRTLMGDDY